MIVLPQQQQQDGVLTARRDNTNDSHVTQRVFFATKNSTVNLFQKLRETNAPARRQVFAFSCSLSSLCFALRIKKKSGVCCGGGNGGEGRGRRGEVGRKIKRASYEGKG